MGACRFSGAVALLLTALLLPGCAQRDPGAAAPAAAAGTWTAVPAPPLTPRLHAVTAWTGTEALVLGGDTGGGSVADGAAYDPVRETWRSVADAPYPLPGGTEDTVAGGTVHLVVGDRLLSYDASEDAWSVSPQAPGGELDGAPAALDDGTVAVVGAERGAGEPSGQLYDPASRTWTALPDDPLGASTDRSATAVPGGLVITATPQGGAAPGATPVVRAAVLEPASQQWTVLDGTGAAGGRRWSWTGERLVDVVPHGWSGALDPITGRWSALEGAPAGAPGGWPVAASAGPVTAVDGWLYDDRDRSWSVLRRPPGAPAEPGPAVWAGDRLLVLDGTGTAGAWLWRRAAG